jgi:LPXTG-motif cell wall-anchored protein
VSAGRTGAGHAIVHLVSLRGSCAADGCAVIGADQSEEGTASAGPLGSILGLGKPSVPYATGTEDANDPLAVRGVDTPEENTPSTNIVGSDEGGAGLGTPGRGHHHHHHHGGGSGTGPGHRHGRHHGGRSGTGTGHRHGRHHGGGQGASSGAASANAAASADAGAFAGTLPTTGAPLAGLLGLAVVAIGAGLFLRQRSKRGEEDQPQED